LETRLVNESRFRPKPKLHGSHEKVQSSINSGLIGDEEVRRARIITSVRCVEYGIVTKSPGKAKHGILTIFKHVFQPFESRVISAFIDITFTKAGILLLQPDKLDDSESEANARKLAGNLTIVYPASSSGPTLGAGISGELETTHVQKIQT
jgi:hypothetical protein